jgi:hypothetical protein
MPAEPQMTHRNGPGSFLGSSGHCDGLDTGEHRVVSATPVDTEKERELLGLGSPEAADVP